MFAGQSGSKGSMTTAHSFVLLTLVCCAPSVHNTRLSNAQHAHASEPSNLDDASTREPAAVLTLAHRWARGRLTIVGVYESGQNYVLRSRHSGCANGTSTIVEPLSRAELESALSALDPRYLPEIDPCAHSVRDGTAWTVSTQVDGKPRLRGRQFGSYETGQCAEFQRAAETLMMSARLSCSATDCLDATRGHERAVCP
jgi:hypothetical protein